jgi:hypothetical protein
LAGMPIPAVKVAKDVLLWLKSRNCGDRTNATALRNLGQTLARPTDSNIS